MCKVSVLMPAYNVERFLEECMDSIVGQSLDDMEIICIDDGSKDRTGEILDSYAEKDNRIRVIHKENSGYGCSMNVGLDHARGEYVGIVETDDFADSCMFEQLYETAMRCRADVVKANYYTYTTNPEPSSTFFGVLDRYRLYNRVFKPAEHKEIFKVRPSIWSGIYRRDMLTENGIRFNETPGASYQDTSFAFQVWACAQRAVLVKEAYLHYRTDNAGSSVKAAGKVYCVRDEIRKIEDFLENRPEKKKDLEGIKNYLMYESYRWNLERLSSEYRYEFLMFMAGELQECLRMKTIDWRYFRDFQWKNMKAIVTDPETYYMEKW